MKSVRIDRAKALAEDPGTGHNRWHPNIQPILEVEPGEEVVLDTRDAGDGRFARDKPIPTADSGRGRDHPLTGPVYIAGAAPGDLLEVEFLEIAPQPYGFTIAGDFGFLKGLLTDPFVAHWDIEGGFATSEQVPGVRIPNGSFMGVSGVAPSREQLARWLQRERELSDSGVWASLPDSFNAVPSDETIAGEGLRTMPPRENGGNFDVKQLTRGSRLFLPVVVSGALFSTGDAHFAQGDGEVCGTAIEMGATVSLRFRLHAGEAARQDIRWPRFARDGAFQPRQDVAQRNFIATMGMPVTDDGKQHEPDLNLAARNALSSMLDLLRERGYSKQQAYIICSVAVDLRISNVVDLPNVTVSAFLPEDIFTG